MTKSWTHVQWSKQQPESEEPRPLKDQREETSTGVEQKQQSDSRLEVKGLVWFPVKIKKAESKRAEVSTVELVGLLLDVFQTRDLGTDLVSSG